MPDRDVPVPGAFEFEGEWRERGQQLPETGMGYTVATVVLKDGREYRQTVIDSGYLGRVRGLKTIPFIESDIAAIVPTHDKFNWDEPYDTPVPGQGTVKITPPAPAP